MHPNENIQFYSHDEESDGLDQGGRNPIRKGKSPRHKSERMREKEVTCVPGGHYRIKTLRGNLFITPAHSSSGRSYNTPSPAPDTRHQTYLSRPAPPPTRPGSRGHPKNPENSSRHPHQHHHRKKHHRRSRSLSIHIQPRTRSTTDEECSTSQPWTKKGNPPGNLPCQTNWGPTYNPPSKSCSNTSFQPGPQRKPCQRIYPVYQPLEDPSDLGNDLENECCEALLQHLREDQREEVSSREFKTPKTSQYVCGGESGREKEENSSGGESTTSSRKSHKAKATPGNKTDSSEWDGEEEEYGGKFENSEFQNNFQFASVKDLSPPRELLEKRHRTKHRSSSRRSEETSNLDNHIFPFRKSPSGNLKVSTDMVAFESKQVAVLVDDPTKTRVSFKQERSHWSKNPGNYNPNQESPPPVPPMPKGLWSGPPSPNCTRPSTAGSEKVQSFPSRPDSVGNPDPKDLLGLNCRSGPSTGRSEKNPLTFPREDDGTGCEAVQAHNQCHNAQDFHESLHYRLRRAIHPDMTVVIDSKEFPCHSLSLQAYSKYFDSLRRPKEMVYRVHLPREVINPENFPNLMDWILLDDASKALVISQCNVLSLYSAAQYLGIPGLKEQCLSYINDKIQSGDPLILQMYEEACGKGNCKELLGLLVEKLVELFPMVYKSRQFLKLGIQELITLIDSDHVKIQSELQIYDTALRWLLYDWKGRNKYSVRVMTCVRFGLLSPLQLTQLQHCAAQAGSSNRDNNNSSPLSQPPPQELTITHYEQILRNPQVMQLIQNGLTFSILHENYKARPGEFHKWVEFSKVLPPRPRYNLQASDIYALNGPLLTPDMTSLPPNFFEVNNPANNSTPARETNKVPFPPKCAPSETPEGPYQDQEVLSGLPNSESLDPTRSGVQNEKRSSGSPPKKPSSTFAADSLEIVASQYEAAVKEGKHSRDSAANVQEPNPEREVEGMASQTFDVEEEELGGEGEEEIFAQEYYQQFQDEEDAGEGFEGMDAEEIFGVYEDEQEEEKPTIQAGLRDNLIRHSEDERRQPEKLSPERRRSSQMSASKRPSAAQAQLDAHRTPSLYFPGRQAILLFGGMNPTQPYQNSSQGNNSQRLHRFDPEQNTWEEIGTLPEPRNHPGVVVMDGLIYLFGGDDPRLSQRVGSGKKLIPSPKTWSLDPASGRWASLSDLQSPRTNFGFCHHRGAIYVFGGKSLQGQFLSSCEKYSVEENAWTSLRSLPEPSMSMSVAVEEDRIFVVGGIKGARGRRRSEDGDREISNGVLVYSPEEDSWTEEMSLGYSVCYAQLGALEGRLYLIGGAGREGNGEGNHTHSLKHVSVYEEGQWVRLGVLKTPRHGHTMVKIGKLLLIMGGVSSDSMTPLDTVEMYNTETNRSSSRIKGMPQALTGMTAIVI